MYLYSSQVIRPCFLPLYSSFFCLSLARSSLLIHAGLLEFFLTSSSLGWTALELRGCDAWILTSILGPLFLLVFIPQDSTNQIFDDAKLCPPEVQGCELAFYPPLSLWDPKLHRLIVTASKTAFQLHFTSEPLLVGEYEVQWAPLLTSSSVTWVKKLMYAKNLQDCLRPAALSLLYILGQLKFPMRTFKSQSEAKTVKACMVRAKDIFTAL